MVGAGDDRDRRHHERHRREQLAEVAVEIVERRLDRIRHRGHRVGHHREREREEDDQRMASAHRQSVCGGDAAAAVTATGPPVLADRLHTFATTTGSGAASIRPRLFRSSRHFRHRPPARNRSRWSLAGPGLPDACAARSATRSLCLLGERHTEPAWQSRLNLTPDIGVDVNLGACLAGRRRPRHPPGGFAFAREDSD